MNFRLTLVAVAVGSASLLTLQSTTAQEIGDDNPLRLYATTPTLTNAAESTDQDLPQAISQLPVVDEEPIIPDEVFAAIYPDRIQRVQQATHLESEAFDPNKADRAFQVPATEVPVIQSQQHALLPMAQAPITSESFSDQPQTPVSAIKDRGEPAGYALLPTPDRGSPKIASTQTLAAMLGESNMNKKTGNRPEMEPASASEQPESGLGHPNKQRESSENFQQMLQKIATSTCLVLFLGVGFIFVARRWVAGNGLANRIQENQTNSTSKNTRRESPPRIQLVANLRLSGKSSLQLVEVGDQRVLIASDLNGIKSVVALNSTFSTSLDTFEEEPAAETTNSNPAGTYSPAMRSIPNPTNHYSAANSRKPSTTGPIEQQSTAEIEAEMKRQLAELLGGQAFKDVFYKQTRAVA